MRGMPILLARRMIVAIEPPSPAVNLYEMYIANDMKVGFWVKRRTWGDLCARITFVGELERHGRWSGGATVRADLYHFVSGTS